MAKRYIPLPFLVSRAATQPTPDRLGQSGAWSGDGGIWGFGRVQRQEFPTHQVRNVELTLGVDRLASLMMLVLGPQESESSINTRARHVSRLRKEARVQQAATNVSATSFLITGGFGGLGLRAATLVAEAGTAEICLAGRSGRVVRDGQGLDLWLTALQRHESTATLTMVSDVSDGAHVCAMLVAASFSGLLHTAGLANRPHRLVRHAASEFSLLFASKAYAAGLLLLGTACIVGSCIFFSSAAALYDSHGYGDYATANACLDHLSQGCGAQGVAAISMQWPQIYGSMGMGAVGIAQGELMPSSQPPLPPPISPPPFLPTQVCNPWQPFRWTLLLIVLGMRCNEALGTSTYLSPQAGHNC